MTSETLEGIKAGSISVLTVYHDSWCPGLNGSAVCCCQPEFETEQLTAADFESLTAPKVRNTATQAQKEPTRRPGRKRR